MFYIIYFIIGLLFGSFYYVVGTRGPKNENYITSKSRCDYCLHELKWYELIPLFSFLIQKGKCRYCHKQIDEMHFLIEILSGILFLIGYILYGNSLVTVMYLIICSVLILIFVSDFKYMIILDEYLIVASIIYIIIEFIDLGLKQTMYNIIAGVALFFTFYIKKPAFIRCIPYRFSLPFL